DASRPERMLVILAGFLVPLFVVPLLHAMRLHSDRSEPPAAHAALAAAMFVLGWCGFPYWGLGVTHAYVLGEQLPAYDPLQNPPGMLPLVGIVWYVAAALGPVIAALTGLGSALLAVQRWGAISSEARSALLLAVVACVLVCLTMPYYFEWLG